MPNRNYERGRRQEYARKKRWEEKGYLVVRASGSHSAFDLVALPINPDWPVHAIQVKTIKEGSEKQAYCMVRKFKADPPLPPSKHFHQTIEVYSMTDHKLTTGTV